MIFRAGSLDKIQPKMAPRLIQMDKCFFRDSSRKLRKSKLCRTSKALFCNSTLLAEMAAAICCLFRVIEPCAILLQFCKASDKERFNDLKSKDAPGIHE